MRHGCLVGLLAAAAAALCHCWGAPRRAALAPGLARPVRGGRPWRTLTRRRAAPVSADPCTLLGLPPGTRDESEVRSAFRRLAKVYHPDVPETGDPDRFQALQEAASRLLEGEELPQFDISEAFRAQKTAFSPRRESVWSPPLTPLGSDGAPGIRPEDAKTYGGQVRGRPEGRAVVEDIIDRKMPNLIKIGDLPKQRGPASEATLRRVREVIADNFGIPAEQIEPAMRLDMLLPMEGDRNIGAKVVADVFLDLEEAFGIELLTVMVRTWVRSKLPADVTTVAELAGLLEAGASSPAGAAAPAPHPAPAPQAQQQQASAAPRPAPQPPGPLLPRPWEDRCTVADQRPYYWNPDTQEALWEPPVS
ncbi:unnamed protein product [Prorocentrum cordatum]|uniref:J domain-containing protein n=1 Tax=Prorocentrum cordatum TaxID=2364126 RepID=A0ABN9W1U5_9DINO|nr:unnamed protein product [Polarella glacialis]